MFGIYNPNPNASERRPNAELLAKMPSRKEVYGMSTEDVEAVFRRTQQNALFAPAVPPIVVDRPPVSPVKPEVVSNVISLAAQHETRIKAAQDEAMTEQDLREADARGAVSAAHGPDIDTLLQDIGYAPAA